MMRLKMKKINREGIGALGSFPHLFRFQGDRRARFPRVFKKCLAPLQDSTTPPQASFSFGTHPNKIFNLNSIKVYSVQNRFGLPSHIIFSDSALDTSGQLFAIQTFCHDIYKL